MARRSGTRGEDSPRPRVGLITLTLSFPGCPSIKEKRARVREVVEGIRDEFSCSVAETGKHFARDGSIVAAALVGRDPATLDRLMSSIVGYVERRDLRLEDFETEVI